jgi:hypothetical protein
MKVRAENQLKGKDHLENLDINGRRVLKYILKKQGVRVWIGYMWLRKAASGGLL